MAKRKERPSSLKWIFTRWHFYLILIVISLYRIPSAMSYARRLGINASYGITEIIIGNFIGLLCGYLVFYLSWRKNK